MQLFRFISYFRTAHAALAWTLLALFFIPFCMGAASPPPTARVTINTASGTKIPLTLEIAATPQLRAMGLMFRQNLAPYDGMMFLFPEAAPRVFWMKNTPLSLDILFVDPQGTIITIAENTTPYALTHYGSTAPASTVIEIEAGRAAREGIAEGDHVRYSLPHDLSIE